MIDSCPSSVLLTFRAAVLFFSFVLMFCHVLWKKM